MHVRVCARVRICVCACVRACLCVSVRDIQHYVLCVDDDVMCALCRVLSNCELKICDFGLARYVRAFSVCMCSLCVYVFCVLSL